MQEKFDRMFRSELAVAFVGLTLTAALFMAAVRSMLSNIPFVYVSYYCVSPFQSSFLIAVPTGCGMVTASIGVRISKKYGPDVLLWYGMVAMLAAPALMLFASFGPQIWSPHWLQTTLPVAVMSATGFFALPAMQVLVLQDFKEMSGFAAGISKLIMTLTSTSGSMVLSYFYSDHARASDAVAVHNATSASAAKCPDPSLPHVAVFLATLAGFILTCQAIYWFGYYIPTTSRKNSTGVGGGVACCDGVMFGWGSGSPDAERAAVEDEERAALLKKPDASADDARRLAKAEPAPPAGYAVGAECCDAVFFNSYEKSEKGINALHPLQWAVLFSIATLGPFSSDAYLPAFPQIKDELHSTDENIALTMQINWIVLGIANPVLGDCADRFGRKKTMLGALTLFICGAVGCGMARSFPVLMAARIVQGFGQAVGIVTFAIIRDLIDDGKERMRLMSAFSVLNPVMIMLAPVFGGTVISVSEGWRYLFIALAGWGALTLVAVALFIPETKDDLRTPTLMPFTGPNSPPVPQDSPQPMAGRRSSLPQVGEEIPRVARKR